MTKDGATRKIKVENHAFVQQIRKSFRENSCKSVTFVVYGVSMHPFLDSGRDKVVLSPPQEPRIGQVILAEVSPRTYALHRIIRIEGDTITMQGDGNPLWMTEQITRDKIAGTATGFIRKGKMVSTESRKWRCYSAFWNSTKPFRRIFLSIYRRIIKKI